MSTLWLEIPIGGLEVLAAGGITWLHTGWHKHHWIPVKIMNIDTDQRHASTKLYTRCECRKTKVMWHDGTWTFFELTGLYDPHELKEMLDEHRPAEPPSPASSAAESPGWEGWLVALRMCGGRLRERLLSISRER